MTSMHLSEILEEILQYSSIETKENLRSGLSQSQLEEIHKDFPFYLPKEVLEMYQWHDGTNVDHYGDCQLFYYHTFLPLEYALKLRESWLPTKEEDYIYFPIELLPLFEFEGEFYCTQCSMEPSEAAPVWFAYHDNSIIYDTLTTMLQSILECYKTEAYLLIDENEEVVDEQRVADIKLKWNPIRKDTYDYCKTRGESYSHP
jgi:hypothetical protein